MSLKGFLAEALFFTIAEEVVMKTVHMQVPRRLHFHVIGLLEPSDQQTYWQIFWHINRYLAAQRASRIASRLMLPVVAVAMLVTQGSFGVTLSVLVGWTALLFAIKRHAQACVRAAELLKASAPEKWQTIGEEVEPVCGQCRPDDPTVQVTFTLPD